MKDRLILFGILILAGLIAGFFLTRRYFPRIEKDTVIEYLERPLADRDTSNAERPQSRDVFEPPDIPPAIPVECPADSSVFRIPNPENAGVINAHPVTFKRGDLVLTSYNLTLGTYVQDTYQIKPPSWGWAIMPYAGWEPYSPSGGFGEVGIEGAIRYKRFQPYGRVFSINDGRLRFTVGLRIVFKGRL